MLTTLTDSSPASLEAIAEEKRIRQTDSLVVLFSMGSQFDHLIVQQLAKIGVFCLVADPAKITASDIEAIAPEGIIVSGGPASVHAEPPPFDGKIFDIGIPVLGICLGFQMWAKHVGARVTAGEKREFHPTAFSIRAASPLFEGLGAETVVLQSHGDVIHHHTAVAWKSLGHTENAPVAAAQCGHLYGVQFHPEVSDSVEGPRMFENFCGLVCKITDRFPAHDVAARKIAELRERIGDKKVLIALSGGSDSSVVAHLLRHAMGGGTDARERRAGDKSRLRGVYIKGIDRPDDEADLIRFFGNKDWIDVKIVDATEEFINALAGITSAKQKRIAMRGVYKAVLEREVAEFGADFIAQGTLYTDLVESGHGHATGARRAQIKLHHNTALDFSVGELTPIADCVKDNARDIGRDIGVPEELLTRHPFPGPGLVVRVEGEITAERLAIARAADGILMHELRAAGLYQKIWQAGAIVTISQHTTTKGDDAGAGCIIMWFAVSSVNGFTSRAYDVPYDMRQKIQDRMGNEIRAVGAVSYRDSGKPYSTIEAQ